MTDAFERAANNKDTAGIIRSFSDDFYLRMKLNLNIAVVFKRLKYFSFYLCL